MVGRVGDRRLPREHWKVVVYRVGESLRARAFVLAQDLSDVRSSTYLDGFQTYEVTIADVERRTGLDLSGIPTDQRRRTAVPPTPRLVASVDDVDW